MKLSTIFVFICLISASIACKCRFFEVDRYFCVSDYVIKAKITTDKQVTTEENEGRQMAWYGIEIQEIYKGNLTKDIEKVWTSSSSASCGSYFTKDEIYIFSGSISDSKLKTYSCAFSHTIDNLSEEQNKFFDEKKYETVECKDQIE